MNQPQLLDYIQSKLPYCNCDGRVVVKFVPGETSFRLQCDGCARHYTLTRGSILSLKTRAPFVRVLGPIESKV